MRFYCDAGVTSRRVMAQNSDRCLRVDRRDQFVGIARHHRVARGRLLPNSRHREQRLIRHLRPHFTVERWLDFLFDNLSVEDRLYHAGGSLVLMSLSTGHVERPQRSVQRGYLRQPPFEVCGALGDRRDYRPKRARSRRVPLRKLREIRIHSWIFDPRDHGGYIICNRAGPI